MSDEQSSRRSLLKLLGGALLGAAGGVGLRAESASAADGDTLQVGKANAAASKTSLATSGAITDDGAFVVNATAADWAIEGSSGQLGVLGSGFIGVMGTGDVGGFFSGNRVAISLQPQDALGAPTGTDVEYAKGDILVDSNGSLFLCATGGKPGTWVRLGGGSQLLPAPVRAYDSRLDQRGKLAGGFPISPRTVDIRAAVPAIPASASGIVGNLTVTQPEGSGFATIWATGDWPGTSNINFSGVDLANAFTCGIASDGTVEIAASVPVHVIVDVVGFLP